MMLLLRLHAWQRSTHGFSVVSFPADLTDVHYRGNLLSVSENVAWNHKDRLSSAVRGENKGTKMSSAALKPLSLSQSLLWFKEKPFQATERKCL